MSDRLPRPTLQFGEFVLDVTAYELRKRGHPVKLERLAMELLLLLVDRRGALVTRAEIVERLWGRDVFVEVDASVNTLVRKIRRALGDSVDDPRFIQTVQGKGYRFSAGVEVAVPRAPASPPAAAGHATDATGPATPGPAQPVMAYPAARSVPGPSRWMTALAVGLAILVAGWFTWGGAGLEIVVAPVTVAVMPFDNLSGDSERDYLADGLTEETAASLSQIDPAHVTVVGRMPTKGYKGSAKSSAEIGRELGVAYLVVESVQAEHTRLRVTANLVRVRDQVQVWSASYDYNGEPVSMLAMQQELGTAVAQQIRLRLSPERLASLAQRHSHNAEAYDLYLRGRSYWNQLTPPSTRRAMVFYEQATTLDPGYALAWSGMADAFASSPITGDVPSLDVRERARQASERALLSGASLAETHTSAGVEQFFLEWDWRRAEAAMRQGIAIDPNYAMSHRLLGVVLSHLLRHDEARIEMHRARGLEPEYVMNHALSAMIELHAGDPDAAVSHARRALAIDSEFWIAHYQLGQAYAQMGRYDLALEALTQSARYSNGNSKALALTGYVMAKAGRRRDAAEILAALDELSVKRYVPPYARALVYLGLGNRDATFDALEKALGEHDVHLIFLPVDPKWNPLRADARFQDLLRRCNFGGDGAAPTMAGVRQRGTQQRE